ncbi:glycoside hydrolase family 27 protein [Silvibacterium acidisoli]|uniref:glycoside hydrolase family 27 protein n=1 Tax=Acidobacteriaceae bacterium ZG23-2 TaxID=2883246 RepID=UPI00406C6EED
MKRSLSALLLLAGSIVSAHAQLAPTPPMGWNSWDAYGLTINEQEFKANVAWFHQHLQPFGWRYVVVDEGWYLAHPENAGKKGADQGFTVSANGLYQPATDRFPEGFKPLVDSVHAMGLKFGIHIVRGIPKGAVEKNLPIAGSSLHASDAADRNDLCRWNADNYGVKDNAAGQAYYDSMARLYASWGVDFLKVDCISQPYDTHEIHMMSAALRKTGRPIVLSLSPGPTPLDQAEDVRKYAQLWRISDDVWDVWSKTGSATFPQSIRNQFALLSHWSPQAGPGHWPDADMLPFGYLGPRPGWGDPRESRLTMEERKTQFTLWSIARSPLILGANLTKLNPAMTKMLTNPEVIAVNQHSSANHPVVEETDTVIWVAREGGDQILAVFNLSDAPASIAYPWSKAGLTGRTYRVRDLWERKETGTSASLKINLPAHGAALLRLR